MPPKKRTLAWLCAALALAATSCAPQGASPQGRDVHDLYNAFNVIAAVVFVIVIGLIAFSIIRFRDRGDGREPAKFNKNIPLEITYFAIPQLIVVGMFVASIFVLNDVNSLSNPPDDPPLHIKVTGFQWGWDFTYIDQHVTVESRPENKQTIEVPVDRPLLFDITSKDVIHSFFIPDLLFKRDAIPGITNKWQVTIDRPGLYDGHCAEFCGLLHDQMYFYIRAVPASDFETWVSTQEQGATGGNS